MAIQQPHPSVETNIDELKKAIQDALAKNDINHAINIAQSGVQAQIRLHGGENHINVARLILAHSKLCMMAKQLDESAQLANRGLAIAEKSAGRENKVYAAFLTVLGNINLQKEHYEEAESYASKAVAILDKALEPYDQEFILTLGVLGRALNAQDRFDEGEAILNRIVIIFEKNDRKEAPDILPYLKDLLRINLLKKRFEHAEVLQRQILSIQERCCKKDDLLLAEECEFLSQIIEELPKTKQTELACEVYRLRALEIREKNCGPNHVSLLPHLEYFALLAIEQNKPIEVEIYYQRV
jgi:hypothetical protein